MIWARLCNLLTSPSNQQPIRRQMFPAVVKRRRLRSPEGLAAEGQEVSSARAASLMRRAGRRVIARAAGFEQRWPLEREGASCR